MKKILYPFILFATLSLNTVAQYFPNGRIILACYKTSHSSSDRKRHLPSENKAKRHNSADSFSYVVQDTLVLHKNRHDIDTLFLKPPKGYFRGKYMYTNDTVVSLNDRYSSYIQRVVKVNNNTHQKLRFISDDYNPKADHSSHMSHYSSR